MTCDDLIAFFAARTYVDDTYFSYPGNEDCVIGATNQIFYNANLRPLNHGETRYWAGYGCDIRGGMAFSTAKALFEAPIYGGKSIRDRWDEITWDIIGGYMCEAQDSDKKMGIDKEN